MNKILKTILLTLLVVSIIAIAGITIFLYQAKISPVYIKNRFLSHIYQDTIMYTIYNNRELSLPIENSDIGPEGQKFGTPFDYKWDILLYNDPKNTTMGNSNISGGWLSYNIPAYDGENYEIGISVCNKGFSDCETQYYKNPICLEIIYVPNFYKREREENLDNCTIVDISENANRSQLYYSIKSPRFKESL